MYVVGSSFFWTMVVYYFFFRVPGREITWKDFVNNYLSKGVVSSEGTITVMKTLICASPLTLVFKCLWRRTGSRIPFGEKGISCHLNQFLNLMFWVAA